MGRIFGVDDDRMFPEGKSKAASSSPSAREHCKRRVDRHAGSSPGSTEPRASRMPMSSTARKLMNIAVAKATHADVGACRSEHTFRPSVIASDGAWATRHGNSSELLWPTSCKENVQPNIVPEVQAYKSSFRVINLSDSAKRQPEAADLENIDLEGDIVQLPHLCDFDPLTDFVHNAFAPRVDNLD